MIRKIARPTLAAVFVADGVDTLVNQKDHQDGARELIARARSITPNAYAKYIPENESTLIQAVAGTKVLAGSMYALGKAPRFAASALVAAQVPTILARHAFWETQDPKEKKARRSGFLTNIGLLGGLLLASADTAGKPGLAWRAQKAGQQVNKQIQSALPTQSEAEKRTAELTASAKAAGETLKDKAEVLQDKAVDAFERAQDYVEDNKDDWRDQLESFAGDVKQTSQDLTKASAKEAKALRKQSAKRWKKARKNASVSFSNVADTVRDAVAG